MAHENDNLYFVFELCPDGTLEDKLTKGRIPGDECLYIFCQLLDAFEILQNHRIVHRDVKPENILIRNDVYK